MQSRALARLKELRVFAETNESALVDDGTRDEWRLSVEIALVRLFGEASACVVRFREIPWSALDAYESASTPPEVLIRSVRTAKGILNAAIADAEAHDPSPTFAVAPTTLQALAAAEVHRWPRSIRIGIILFGLLCVAAFAVWNSMPDDAKRNVLSISATSPRVLPLQQSSTTNEISAAPPSPKDKTFEPGQRGNETASDKRRSARDSKHLQPTPATKAGSAMPPNPAACQDGCRVAIADLQHRTFEPTATKIHTLIMVSTNRVYTLPDWPIPRYLHIDTFDIRLKMAEPQPTKVGTVMFSAADGPKASGYQCFWRTSTRCEAIINISGKPYIASLEGDRSDPESFVVALYPQST